MGFPNAGYGLLHTHKKYSNIYCSSAIVLQIKLAFKSLEIPEGTHSPKTNLLIKVM